MLHEIDLAAALMQSRHRPVTVLALGDNPRVLSLAEALAPLQGCRFLVDVPDGDPVEPEDAGPAETEEPEDIPGAEEAAAQTEPAEDPAPHKRGRKPGKGRAEAEILAAWGCGRHTIQEVQKMTGYSMPTVRRYLPISPNG